MAFGGLVASASMGKIAGPELMAHAWGLDDVTRMGRVSRVW